MKNDEQKIPLVRALWIILISVFLVSGTAFTWYYLVGYVHKKRQGDSSFTISHIAQEKQDLQLSGLFLSELLDVSKNRPCNLYDYDYSEKSRKCSHLSIFKVFSVLPQPPNALFVRYMMRAPVALVSDCTNCAIDEDGIFFAVDPYYESLSLPKVNVGMTDCPHVIKEKIRVYFPPIRCTCPSVQLALDILKSKSEFPTDIELSYVDTHSITKQSAGVREIVFSFLNKDTGQIKCYWVRTNIGSWKSELNRFFSIRSTIQEQKGIKDKVLVDMRNDGFCLFTHIP